MRYLSVCSGIEAATVAWHPLGWTPVGFSEIEPFPRAVLEQRHGGVAVDWGHRWSAGQNYPPIFGDFTKIEAHHVGPVDLLVGGTPCQSFSVAGKRLGLDDPRGNLAIEFLALAKRVGARWVVWENVPGVYSSWSGEPDDDAIAEWVETADFVEFLNLFRECGYRGAWRTIDAQYVRVDGFGRAVPQRRRRVFLVGHLGDDARAIPVLFDPESLRGVAAPRREAGQGTSVASGLHPEGHSLDGGIGSPSGAAATVSAKWAKGSGGPAGDECQNLVAAPVCPTLTAGGNATGGDRQPGTTADHMEALIGVSVAHTLRAEGFDASEDGTGRGTPIVIVPVAPTISARTRGGGGLGTDAECDGAVFAVPICIHADAMNRDGVSLKPSVDAAGVSRKRDAGLGIAENVSFNLTTGTPHAVAFSIKDDGRDVSEDVSEDVSPCLRSMNAVDSNANAGGQVAVAYQANDYSTGQFAEADTAGAITAGNNRLRAAPIAAIPSVGGWAVRKLTPRECERLQGFPDDFTAIQVRGKPAADGPRYKAIGNSMAVNVMRWIGTRIALVEKAVEAAGDAA